MASSGASTSSTLENFVNHEVEVITNDGRVIVGKLKGFDQTINVIMEGSHERVFSTTAGVERVPLGLYIVRGDNICVIGTIDPEVDESLDFDEIRAAPLASVQH
eukprot:Opistho-1_new@19074